jgi:acetoin utilization protein AcuB
LVLDDNELIGVVSDRDILKHISPFISTPSERTQDLTTLEKRIHQVMSRKLITIQQETTIEQAAEIIVQEGVSCLPVLSARREVVGIITWRDILKQMIAAREQEKEIKQGVDSE